MINVGITGQPGFVGTHLYNELGLLSDSVVRIPFEDSFFESEAQLRAFVKQCDVIVHLAAMNRHPDPGVIYETNIPAGSCCWPFMVWIVCSPSFID